MKYEINITGSSRPSLYPIFWESFNKMVKMKKRPKITVYEDVILEDKSNKVKNYIKDKVDDYIEVNPNKRLGYIFNLLLNNIKTEYYIYLQEDWKFLKEIDIDKLVNIMDNNPNIIQIWFPKILENYTYNTYCRKTIKINDENFVPYSSWAFLPHIGRTDFVKKIWHEGQAWRNARPEAPFKKILQKKGIIVNDKKKKEIEEWKKKGKTISYILGNKFDEYIQHLGLPSDDGIKYDLRSTKMIELRDRKKKK